MEWELGSWPIIIAINLFDENEDQDVFFLELFLNQCDPDTGIGKTYLGDQEVIHAKLNQAINLNAST